MPRCCLLTACLILLAWSGPGSLAMATEPAKPLIDIEVTVIEISRDRLWFSDTEAGKQWESLRGGPTAPPLFVMQTSNPGEFLARMEKLQAAGIARTLARKHFVVESGRQASCDDKEPTGHRTEMKIVATAAATGAISLECDIYVGTVDSMGGRDGGGSHFTVEMENDQLYAQGLVTCTSTSVTQRKTCLLGYLPGIGRYFTREETETKITEVLYLVRSKRIEGPSGSPMPGVPSAN